MKNNEKYILYMSYIYKNTYLVVYFTNFDFKNMLLKVRKEK